MSAFHHVPLFMDHGSEGPRAHVLHWAPHLQGTARSSSIGWRVMVERVGENPFAKILPGSGVKGF